MKKTVVAVVAALGIFSAATVQATDGAKDMSLVKALQTCSADFFKAVAQNKNIPEKYKVRDGDFAYFKVEKQPLEVVKFDKPFKEDGLAIAGYILNDEIIRYFGVPDMHSHFWGLLVMDDWKAVVDSIKLDWEAVDMNHRSAHALRQTRMNDEPGSTWKAYTRPSNYEFPEFGQIERAFHVAPFNDMTIIFCSMQSAGAPEEAILREVRPDLLFGEKQVPIREEATEGIDKDGNPVKKEGEANTEKKMPEGHPATDTLPAGHPDISGDARK